MRSGTSYFNRTIFWHDLKRYWPLWAGYALIWQLLMPLNLFTVFQESWEMRMVHAHMNALSVAVEGGVILSFCFGILFAMAFFSYLAFPGATNAQHALPVKREALYLTHYLAGLCGQLGTQAAALLLTGAALAAGGFFDLRVLGLMAQGMALPTLLFYSFGVLCMVFSGQILAAPVFYGILNFLAVVMENIVYVFAGNFLYGWSGDPHMRLSVLSPFVRLLLLSDRPLAQYVTQDFPLSETLPSGAALSYIDNAARTQRVLVGVTIEGLGMLWAYAAAGLVFAVLGLLVYRARRSEATGMTVAITWARPVFKYGAAFCAAISIGELLYYLLFGRYRANGSFSLAEMLLCVTAAGLIGYFAAEMLLKKSFRVWKSGWKGAVVMTAVLAALGIVLSSDPIGYESWTPDLTEVTGTSVNLSVYGTAHSYVYTKDEGVLRLTAAAHRAMIEDKARQQAGSRTEDSSASEVHGSFEVTYYMKDGRVIRRQYHPYTIWAEDLANPGSVASALTALYNDPTVAKARVTNSDRWENLTGNNPRFTGGRVYIHPEDEAIESGREWGLTAGEAADIYDALLRDVAAGHADGSLFEQQGRWYEGDLELYVVYESQTIDASDDTMPAAVEEGTISIYPVLYEGMSYTIDTLRAMGIEVRFSK